MSILEQKNVSIYRSKRRWKLILLVAALVIVAVSLYYSNVLVKKIAKDERQRIQTWAKAIQHSARLVNSTNLFFEQLKSEERRRVELYAEAQNRYINASENDNDISFYLKILENNKTIPVILTDEAGNITASVNTENQNLKYMTPLLLKEYSQYKPIVINYYAGKKNFLYYKDSRIFTEIQVVLKNLINSFFNDIVNNSASVPVIITDSSKKQVINASMIDSTRLKDSVYIEAVVAKMASQNEPISLKIADRGQVYIFYEDSFVLTQLRYFPYIQFALIGLFLLVAYMLFSTARRSEQNQVWVGLAKETAHQLGTPLSSIMAWVDYLDAKGLDSETVEELHKDLKRLNTITDRFSKIGSPPLLKPENIVSSIYDSIGYLKTRTSQKVVFHINLPSDHEIIVPLNLQLFDWVIENLVKNAIDAMAGKGEINIEIIDEGSGVRIDLSDTGKGIPRNMQKTIFNPGFSSKQRGWGLGLSLSKRIINEYHKGKIFVKSSVPGKGTTFRIILNK